MMITVAVIAILAAIALPSYQSHLRKSRRAEAQSFMMAVAGRQQQFMVDTRAYAATVAGTGIAVPSNVNAAYTIAMPAPTTSTFTLTLSPTIDQQSERCGRLSIDQNGTRSADVSGCW
jgi:type IV pilus assembly protein PilE